MRANDQAPSGYLSYSEPSHRKGPDRRRANTGGSQRTCYIGLCTLMCRLMKTKTKQAEAMEEADTILTKLSIPVGGHGMD